MSDRTKGILVLIVIAVGFFLVLGLKPLINKLHTPFTKKEVNKYIENSKLETFELKEEWLNPNFNIMRKNSRKINHKNQSMDEYCFFVPEHKKYFSIIVYFEWKSPMPTNGETYMRKQTKVLSDMKPGSTFTALVNQNQLNNPEYGTKENPIPIWAQEILIYNGVEVASVDPNATDKESVHFLYYMDAFKPDPELFPKTIKAYLIHYMPVEEFKEMFR